ncbi:MAG: vanadium-dependent haloperoxidase [Planctomycetes bacterium]|nr:vanadium-dependent haloperoxidase [Planctomycetota bacterium]
MRRSEVFLLAVLAGCAGPAQRDPDTGWIIHQAPNPRPTAAYRWLEVMLEASARCVDRIGARPTILSREMAVAVTAMYDAWAAYDEVAVGTRLGGKLRRPAAERTLDRKEKAIAHAMHAALVWLYPEDRAWIDGQMRGAGCDPADKSVDPATPQGVGHLAAAAVIEYRKDDGANQFGGKPYADTTGYQPKNPPDKILDPDRWQQIPFDDGKGGTIFVNFLTPHWGRVKPFALERGDQFRPGPFPKVGTEQLKKEVDECIAYNGNLSLEQKAIVEFMRDGPRSTGQSGHWLRFSQDVSRRDAYDLDRDVKLFFCVANVVFDAFIACWEAKYVYDSSRPWTLIRHLYRGQKIVGYFGPCKGFATIPAEQWHPYSPSTFVTPPFPGYPSGHSTASAASARMLELFTGSDRYEAVALRVAGELTEAKCGVPQMQAREGKPAEHLHATPEVTLKLPTFSATAQMAGISRIMGGYHIQADNVAGLDLGRKVADWCWPKCQAYFSGNAP